MKTYLQLQHFKTLAENYLPAASDFHSDKKRFNKKGDILQELDNHNVIENNFEEIKAFVNSAIGEKP